MSKKFNPSEYSLRLIGKEFACFEEDSQPKSKIRYYIDEEKQTVVAVMDDCEYDAIDVLQKMGIRNISYDGYNMNKFMMNPTYRGKAKCSPEDEWDEEYGMTLARNRMLENYYRSRAIALMKAETVLQNILDEIGSRIDYADYRCSKAYSGEL